MMQQQYRILQLAQGESRGQSGNEGSEEGKREGEIYTPS
jgi:hypothetical protein